jgi:hypothetical protein
MTVYEMLCPIQNACYQLFLTISAVYSSTYHSADELAVISIAAEEIHTFAVEAVSGYDSAIHIDWEADN